MVPDEIKKVFEVLNSVPSGVSSSKQPKNIKKGIGKKGDEGNPKSPTKPRPGGGTNKPGNNGGVKTKCNTPPGQATRRLDAQKSTIRFQSCDKNSVKKTTEMIVTSLAYAPNAVPTQNKVKYDAAWGQAFYHYSSAISVNPQWGTITCPQEAATTRYRLDAKATATWSSQHRDKGWKDVSHRNRKGRCDRDEYPPANLVGPNDQAYLRSGLHAKGQLVR